MEAVINLKHEPKLREEFEYAHVVNNTVLVDRRTRWATRGAWAATGPARKSSPATAPICGAASARAKSRWRSSPRSTDAGWRAGAIPNRATAMCSPAQPPGPPGNWRSGPMADATSCIPSTAVPSRTAHEVRAGGEIFASRRDRSLCHVCSLRQPASPVLRSAPARGGSARRRDRATVAQAQVPPGLVPRQAPLGPCARTTRPAATPSSTNPACLRCAHMSQRTITSGIGPSVQQPIA